MHNDIKYSTVCCRIYRHKCLMLTSPISPVTSTSVLVCLIFTSQSTIFQLCRDGSSWVEPINVSYSRTQHSDASETGTCGPSVSSQALYHWATVFSWCALECFMNASFFQVFFGTMQARNALSANSVGINCSTGMSSLFRREIVEAAGGLPSFAKYLAEDHFIAIETTKQ